MATIPKVTDALPLVQFSYIGSYEVLPEVAPEGTVALHHGRTFIHRNGLWIELADLVSSAFLASTLAITFSLGFAGFAPLPGGATCDIALMFFSEQNEVQSAVTSVT